MMRPARVLLLFVLLFALRLCHRDLVWVEEGYPAAAALQMLDGKVLYRDLWFDKPPLFPAVYMLWGAHTGVPLRLAGALFVLACCWMLYRFAREMWGEQEGVAAAALLGFFLTFGIPSAVMALAPDLLMILPHIAAVYCAWRGRPLLSGIMAGCAMLLNTKAAFVLLACLIWQYGSLPWLLAGFAIPNLLAAGWMAATGALAPYWQQVWAWGWLYSRDTFVERPLVEGVLRTLNWAGFQAALVAGACCFFWRHRSRSFALWIAIAFAGVAAGWRFFPRYYFLLLPPFCLLAARTFTQSRRMRYAMLALLLIPLVRFGPRYVQLLRGDPWLDLAMIEDSRDAARLLQNARRPGDTLLVWGYRPDIFAFTRLPAGTRFLDSQPLTGVIADRHLTHSDVAAPELAARNRRELAASAPAFIVDGLAPFNPQLAITRYPDLSAWLAGYEPMGRTRGTIIYRKKP